jgi:hypothetical protein
MIATGASACTGTRGGDARAYASTDGRNRIGPIKTAEQTGNHLRYLATMTFAAVAEGAGELVPKLGQVLFGQTLLRPGVRREPLRHPFPQPRVVRGWQQAVVGITLPRRHPRSSPSVTDGACGLFMGTVKPLTDAAERAPGLEVVLSLPGGVRVSLLRPWPSAHWRHIRTPTFPTV